MKITQIHIYPAREGLIKAYASVVLDECFIVREIRLVEGKDGLFVSMPSRKLKDGSYKDIVHPLDAGTRKDFEDQVVAKYKELYLK